MNDNVILNKFKDTPEYRQMESKLAKYTRQEWEAIKDQYVDIIGTMVDVKEAGKGPDSEDMQELVQIWKKYINDFYYTCDKARLRSYYKLYKEDVNFKKQLDEFNEGFSDYLADAIDFYLKNN